MTVKELTHQKDTSSYMQLCLEQEGKSKLYLLVPTYWDAVRKKWIGFLKTPKGKFIKAEGKDSFELQNNFNIALNESFENDPEETYRMFKPLEYWESRIGS